MANAEDANHDRLTVLGWTVLKELCINAACMNDAKDLGMSRRECMNLAQKIWDNKMTEEGRQTPAVRAIIRYEKERELQIKNMIIQATQTSTETGVGRAVVQKTTDELNLEIDALVPNVRFLYELVERMERQRLAVSGTPFEKSFDDAEVFMSNSSKLQQGTLVADITKHFSNSDRTFPWTKRCTASGSPNRGPGGRLLGP